MRAIADTNVLLRAFLNDDVDQGETTIDLLDKAEIVAIGLPALCEFAWVLTQTYKVPRLDVAAAIQRILDTQAFVVERSAVEAGLAVLEAGGDFADGVIAHTGLKLGGETFVSFDRRAVRILADRGHATQLLT